MEVINVWSGSCSVSTSWHGCAPPVVTESSEKIIKIIKFTEETTSKKKEVKNYKVEKV